MISLIALALAPAFPQCPTPSENRIFKNVRTGSPYSVPNAMAVTSDGRYIYSGEGGSIAIVDTEASGGYGYSAPRIPISKYGARPAMMLLDEGSDPGYTDDMLVICAGRSGLWVMDADPDATYYRAAVVDDSANTSVVGQGSRRFCNDAAFFTIDGVEYLAAVFARKQGSRLRIYDMASVRAVLGSVQPGEWTGGEIAALHDIKLAKRSGVPYGGTGQPNLLNIALSIGLDVDQVGPDDADLYVALWHQGLVRVRVSADGPGALSTSGVQYGPVFGDGSAYHSGATPAPNPPHHYSNFRYIEDGEVRREEPPVFSDVAVQNTPGLGHYLYATVDTLGWVRFDLSDPVGNPWSPSMDIDHHEGSSFPPAPEQHPFGEIQYALGGDYSYPAQVRVIKSMGRILVAVHASGASIVRNVGHRTEGSVFNHAANTFNGIPDYFFLDEAIIGGKARIFIWGYSDLSG